MAHTQRACLGPHIASRSKLTCGIWQGKDKEAGEEGGAGPSTADADKIADTAPEGETRGGDAALWAALPSVVSWNLSPRRKAATGGGCDALASEAKTSEDGKEGVDRDKTPEREYEPPCPYDYNASYVSSIIDVKNLKWAMDRALKFAKPEVRRPCISPRRA